MSLETRNIGRKRQKPAPAIIVNETPSHKARVETEAIAQSAVKKSGTGETKPKSKKGSKRDGAGRLKGIFKLTLDDKTLQTIEGLGKIQATTKECAAVLGVSEPTLIDFFKRDKKAQ